MTTPDKKRLKGVVVEKPIIIGSMAWPLGKKAEEGKTHRWICYIRGLQGEDLSYFIKKVIFSLHPSFQNPKRAVERFPFEVQESGWGEFEIGIKIIFVDPTEKPVDVYHTLKLYQGAAPAEGQPIPPQKKPTVFEQYEELIFNSPKEEFHKILTETKITPMALRGSRYSEHWTKFNEAEELRKIQDVQKRVKIEIQKLRDRCEQMESEIQSIQGGTGTPLPLPPSSPPSRGLDDTEYANLSLDYGSSNE